MGGRESLLAFALVGEECLEEGAAFWLAHAAGTPVSGSGITLTTALTRKHVSGSQVSDNLPTPGAPNRYSRKAH